MIITSELTTPISRVDLEPAGGLPGKVLYHVWERTGYSITGIIGDMPVREYRGMVSAEKLAPILFPEGK